MSPESAVAITSPSEASRTRAASITSVFLARARSSPARLPRYSLRGRTSIPVRAFARRAERGPCPLHAWPTIPLCVTGISLVIRADFKRRHILRSLRSSAIRLPLSRMSVILCGGAGGVERQSHYVDPNAAEPQVRLP